MKAVMISRYDIPTGGIDPGTGRIVADGIVAVVRACRSQRQPLAGCGMVGCRGGILTTAPATTHQGAAAGAFLTGYPNSHQSVIAVRVPVAGGRA